MKRSDVKLEKAISRLSREQLEVFARYVALSVYGDTSELGNIFLDSERDRDSGDVMSDVIGDLEYAGLRPQDL